MCFYYVMNRVFGRARLIIGQHHYKMSKELLEVLVQCDLSSNLPTSKSITGDIPESSLGSCNFSYTGKPVTSSQMATMLKASPISHVATVAAPVLL